SAAALVRAIVGVIAARSRSPRKRAGGSGPRRILPLRLAGQAIGLSGFARQPRRVRPGVILTDVRHRPVAAAEAVVKIRSAAAVRHAGFVFRPGDVVLAYRKRIADADKVLRALAG